MSTQTRKATARRKAALAKADPAEPPLPSKGFSQRMFEGAVHRSSVAKSPMEAVFALGQAWAWAELAEEQTEESILYQRRINAIVLRLHQLGLKPLPAELPKQLGSVVVQR